MLTAVIGVLLVGLFALARALEQTPSALGALARHLHHQRHGEVALRPAGTGQEAAEPAGLDDQVPPALGTDLLRNLVWHLDALPVQVLLRLVELCLKAAVEVREHLLPVGLSLLHLVQPLLHLGGEGVVHDIVEFVLHQAGDHLAQRGGAEVLPLLHHVLPVQDGGDGGGVGGGASDTLLFQSLDEGGLGVPGGGLGEVLVLLQPLPVQRLPLPQVGEGGLGCLVVLVPALLIHGGKAGEFQLRVAGPEGVAGGLGLDGYAVIDRACHLAGQEPAPDQPVEAVLLRGQVLLHVLRGEGHVGGTDGLVGVLGIALGLVASGLGGIVLLAVAALDKALGGGDGLLGQAQRVSTHIGDQAHGALPGDVHALIELLGDRHGAGGGHVQLAAGLLLEGGGREGGRRIAQLVLPLHPGHGEGGGGHRPDHLLRLLPAAELHLLLPAVELGLEAPQIWAHPLQLRLDSPVLLGDKGPDFLLPLRHQPGGHRLDPPGGQAPPDLPPQQGGEFIAHDAVQDAPRLLGVHQVLVDGPGGGNRVVDHLLGDLVEGDPIGLVVRDIQQLLQMPGDGLPLPVRVGGQIDPAALLGCLLQVADHVLFALDGLVLGDKASLDVHADLALRQVPDVAHGRLHLIARPQVLPNGLGLGRRLYDHQIGLCCHQITSKIEDKKKV